MKISNLIASLVFILIFSSLSIAQINDYATLPFLTLSPSPQQNGLGWTGVSNPNDDPFGFYLNPAMIGYSSQHTNLSIQFYPSRVDWLGFNDLKFNSYAFNLGYNFVNEPNGLRVSAGAGFIHSNLDYGKLIIYRTNAFDSYNAYGFGVAMNYFISLSIGITFKDIHSQFTQITGLEAGKHDLDATALDYGILLSIPVVKLIDDNFSVQIDDESKFKPTFNYSIGYSRLNIGDEVYYVDPAQADPIPLTARLGHTIGIGINFVTNDIKIKLINYDLILEAEDILIMRDSLGNSTYQGMLGDIDIWKNLIELKGDDNVVVHKGHAINFLETLTILNGSFIGRDYYKTRFSNGIIISTKGLFKWLNSFDLNSEFLEFITRHFEIRYISTINLKDDLDSDFSGISLSFSNFYF